MIFPEQKKSSKLSELGGLITRFGKDHHPQFDVPAPLKIRKLCMKAYLDGYKRMLFSGEFVHQEDFDISDVVTNINNLFVCCRVDQYCGTSEADVYCFNRSLLTAMKRVSIVICLKEMYMHVCMKINIIGCSQVIKSGLEDVILELDLLSGLPAMTKLVAAAVLMCCAHCVTVSHMSEPVNEKTNVVLLKMLALQSDGGFKFLCSFMKEKYSK